MDEFIQLDEAFPLAASKLMMELFKINYSVDPRIIGYVNQQMESYVGDYEYWGKNSFTQIPLSGKIEFELKFPTFKLYSAAKRTDLLQNTFSMGRTLLLSPKAKELLEHQYLDSTQWYEVKVLHNVRRMNYYILYMPNDRQSELINWSASSFAIVHRKEFNYEGGVMRPIEVAPLSLNSFEEYLSEMRSLRDTEHKVRLKKAILVENIKFDLFRMRGPLLGFFCSNRLKTAIEEAGLTGFRFEPVNR